MVAPKEQALGCGDCHAPTGSRLASVEGVYMPGRDHNRWLDIVGTLVVASTLAGIIIHGLVRFFSPKSKSKSRGEQH
jgi:metallophosphoesterase superfamily enzyme